MPCRHPASSDGRSDRPLSPPKGWPAFRSYWRTSLLPGRSDGRSEQAPLTPIGFGYGVDFTAGLPAGGRPPQAMVDPGHGSGAALLDISIVPVRRTAAQFTGRTAASGARRRRVARTSQIAPASPAPGARQLPAKVQAGAQALVGASKRSVLARAVGRRSAQLGFSGRGEPSVFPSPRSRAEGLSRAVRNVRMRPLAGVALLSASGFGAGASGSDRPVRSQRNTRPVCG